MKDIRTQYFDSTCQITWPLSHSGWISAIDKENIQLGVLRGEVSEKLKNKKAIGIMLGFPNSFYVFTPTYSNEILLGLLEINVLWTDFHHQDSSDLISIPFIYHCCLIERELYCMYNIKVQFSFVLLINHFNKLYM